MRDKEIEDAITQVHKAAADQVPFVIGLAMWTRLLRLVVEKIEKHERDCQSCGKSKSNDIGRK